MTEDQLAVVETFLFDLSQRDCCADGGDDCQCESCGARAVLKALEPKHEGQHLDRLRYNPAELVFHEEWKKENERHRGINSGFTTLEHILRPDGKMVPRVSDRDAQVAADVIQWLGTNCGLGFLSRCEQKSEVLRKIYSLVREHGFKVATWDLPMWFSELHHLARLISLEFFAEGLPDQLRLMNMIICAARVNNQYEIDRMISTDASLARQDEAVRQREFWTLMQKQRRA